MDWQEHLAVEHDNLCAAMKWALTRPDGTKAAMRVMGGLSGLYSVRAHYEEWTRALAVLQSRDDYMPLVQSGVGLRIHSSAAELALQKGDWERCFTLSQEGVTIAKGLNRRQWTAEFLTAVSMTLANQWKLAPAIELAGESIALWREGDLRQGLAGSLICRSGYLTCANDLESARQDAEESLQIAIEEGDGGTEVWARLSIGLLALRGGLLDEATEQTKRALKWMVKAEWPYGILIGLQILAGAAAQAGNLARGVRLWGAGIEYRFRVGMISPMTERIVAEEMIEPLHERLGDAEYEAYLDEGKSMTTEDAVAYALSEERGGIGSAAEPAPTRPPSPPSRAAG